MSENDINDEDGKDKWSAATCHTHPMPVNTAGATLLKPATPAVLDSLMISYQLACTTAAMGYLIIHQCIWCPLQRTSKYPTFNDTRSAGKQASVLVM